MKLIIAGSRDIPGDVETYVYALARSFVIASERNPEFGNRKVTEIVSGGARGGDALGERLAKELDIPLHTKPANWKKYGNAAGPIRNEEMADYADALLVIWDGKTRGTKNMISHMNKRDLPVHKIIFNRSDSAKLPIDTKIGL